MNYQHLVLGFLSMSTAFAWMGTAQAATLTHDYDLKTSLSDIKGGESLVSGGGTLSAAGYAFGPNQGLTLSNSIVPSSYTVFLDFSFADTAGYRKIVDFKDLASDNGLYNLNGKLNLYIDGDVAESATPTITANTPLKLALTRNASGQTSTYLNGVQQFSFLGISNSIRQESVFTAANSIINFFNDDSVTSFGEASSGLVSRISIYDGALSAADASVLTGGAASTAVPEPFTIVGTLIGGTAALRMRKKLKATDKV
jgi:hypothetical protein